MFEPETRKSKCYSTHLPINIFSYDQVINHLDNWIFRHARVSSTYPCTCVRHTFEFPFYQCVSLVALREKLKKADPNYFRILGLGRIS